MSQPARSDDLFELSLRSLAAIRAALAEGFPLDEALRVEGVSRARWNEGSAAWTERIARDVREGNGALALRLVAARREAEDALARSVRPADRDAAAFVDLAHAIAKSRAPEALLAKWGLRRPDIRRLERSWAERAAADPETAEALRAATALRRRPPAPIAGPRAALRPMPSVDPSLPVVGLDAEPAAPHPAGAALPRRDVGVAPAESAVDDSTLVLSPQASAPSDTTMTAVEGAFYASEDGFRAELTAVAIPDMGLDSYAMFQAELRMKGALDASMAHRYGVASVAVQRALELRYREIFVAHPDLADRFASKLRKLLADFQTSS